jgi:hypothetical protein
MEEEGFDYCFLGYSNWKEVEDQEFQAKREAYVKAQKELEGYINMVAKREGV